MTSTEVRHPRFIFRDQGRLAGVGWSHPGAVTKVFALRNASGRAAPRVCSLSRFKIGVFSVVIKEV